jgi:hypothetical protein
MKGKIETITPKSWSNPEGQVKKFAEITIEGIQKQYSCWDAEIATKKVGDEIEFTEVEKNGRWSLRLVKAGGGYKKDPAKSESFACAYSKDIAVALIAVGIVKTSKEVDATVEHYFRFFMDKLEPKGEK